MNLLNSAILAAKDEEFDPNQVSPGVAGFFAVAVLAAALVLLGLSLVSRLRRGRYRAEVREQIAEELADGAEADAGQDPAPAADASPQPEPGSGDHRRPGQDPETRG